MVISSCCSAVSGSFSPLPHLIAKFPSTSRSRRDHRSRLYSRYLTSGGDCYLESTGRRRTPTIARPCFSFMTMPLLLQFPPNNTTSSCRCISVEALDVDKDFIVVNFYRFVFIKDPQFEVYRHLSFLHNQGLDIHGRIYLNEQGINAQYSGPSTDVIAYLEWLRQDHRFSDILVQISPACGGHAFPRLKLRYKPSLVQLEGGHMDLPLLDPSMHATPLAPDEWRKWLELSNNDGDVMSRDSNEQYILLDVRNGYEWDVGHFRGARRPEVDCFRSTSFGLSNKEVPNSDPLASIDKGRTNILMYCTGGIRCDVYSTILRQKGYQNLYTLRGGVSHYLEKKGPADWIGNLFVFDSRLSLPPSSFACKSGEMSRASIAPEHNRFARCYVCGVRVHELRHRNCANLDCNLLFLCCKNCLEEQQGCCCSNCMTATRLRPIMQGNQTYKKWHHYRDNSLKVS